MQRGERQSGRSDRVSARDRNGLKLVSTGNGISDNSRDQLDSGGWLSTPLYFTQDSSNYSHCCQRRGWQTGTGGALSTGQELRQIRSKTLGL